MPLAFSGRVLLFDYGEVLSRSPSEEDRQRLAVVAGVPEAELWRAYQADRDRLDQGLVSTTEYWTGIGRACGQDWDLARIQALWALDIRIWTVPDPRVSLLIGELAAAGARMAVLSNASAEYGGLLRYSPVGTLFERVLVSGELLLLKPDPAIFRYAAEALSTPPEDVVFVDNRAENVRGAESIGMTGHVHTDAASLRRFLERLAAEAGR